MRFYDPLDAAPIDASPLELGFADLEGRAQPEDGGVAPAFLRASAAKSDATRLRAVAAQVASGRRQRLAAHEEAARARAEADCWDFGADPMLWARTRYGAWRPSPRGGAIERPQAAETAPAPEGPTHDVGLDVRLKKTSQIIAQLFGMAQRAA